MISHKHKCIFIHISKCAGTSVENAFGVPTTNYNADENDYLFGWDKVNQLWLQHATPQQLIDLKLIGRESWKKYYKFIIFRNSWSRAYSDFLWMQNVRGVNGSFINYLRRNGEFKRILNDKTSSAYAGDHLKLQKDYFFLDGIKIKYHQQLDFDDLNTGLSKVIQDLSLPKDFFSKKMNESTGKKFHYSFFYNNKRRKAVAKVFKEDIEFFGFSYEEKKLSYNNFWL